MSPRSRAQVLADLAEAKAAATRAQSQGRLLAAAIVRDERRAAPSPGGES